MKRMAAILGSIALALSLGAPAFAAPAPVAASAHHGYHHRHHMHHRAARHHSNGR